MRVPKKEGISREERERKNVGRFVITRCLCNANLGHATRISACGASFGHVGRISDISDVLATAKFELGIFLAKVGASRDISARKAHLGAHLGVLDRAVSRGRV